jgi:hypothetical protein
MTLLAANFKHTNCGVIVTYGMRKKFTWGGRRMDRQHNDRFRGCLLGLAVGDAVWRQGTGHQGGILGVKGQAIRAEFCMKVSQNEVM